MVIRDVGGAFHKVQVKRAYYRVRGNSKTLRVNITDSRGAVYGRNAVDIMAIVDADTFQVWFIPMVALKRQKTLGLSGGKWDKWLV
jgi:hypothetical protein